MELLVNYGIKASQITELPLAITTYVSGINRTINQSGYLIRTNDGASGSSPCNSRPNSTLTMDLRGILISSIETSFTFEYTNSQPRIGVYNNPSSVTFNSSTGEWEFPDIEEVQVENLFTTYGASPATTTTSRTYTFATPRDDLLFRLTSTSCQASGDRFMQMNSLTINGQSIVSVANTNNQTVLNT